MYFAESGDPRSAAEIIETATEPLDGNQYPQNLKLIKLLGDAEPLAATLLYRANMESILASARSKNYRYAASYANKLFALDSAIHDWKQIQPHKPYWETIQQKHKFKTSFWALMKE